MKDITNFYIILWYVQNILICGDPSVVDGFNHIFKM